MQVKKHTGAAREHLVTDANKNKERSKKSVNKHVHTFTFNFKHARQVAHRCQSLAQNVKEKQVT